MTMSQCSHLAASAVQNGHRRRPNCRVGRVTFLNMERRIGLSEGIQVNQAPPIFPETIAAPHRRQSLGRRSTRLTLSELSALPPYAGFEHPVLGAAAQDPM
jgi:hypothetical protein